MKSYSLEARFFAVSALCPFSMISDVTCKFCLTIEGRKFLENTCFILFYHL